jgi:two-component system, chemotaxis family, protein-glutamate methylesterase/glutaminase
MLNQKRLKRDIVVIGASAGGLQALHTLFEALPADVPAAVCIVLHRSAMYNQDLAHVMSRWTTLHLVETESELLSPGTIYLAPADHHLLIDGPQVQRWKGPPENRFRPAIDPLFRSAAREYGARVVGVILSGAGSDGIAGLTAITSAGGLTLVQDPGEAVMASMPRYALRGTHIDSVLPMTAMADTLIRLARGETVAPHLKTGYMTTRFKREA